MQNASLALATALSLLAPSPSVHAQDELRLVVDQRLVGLLNPMGAEHMVAVGLRAPLFDPRELIFTDAHVAGGLVSYTSPVDAYGGAYLQVSPLAFLVLRAELAALAMWPAGLPGAAYYPVEGYDADVRGTTLIPEQGQRAAGIAASLSATLRGAVPLGPARLILWAQGTASYERLGEAAYRYSPRRDLVLAREDWIASVHGMLLSELPLAPGHRLRLGAFEELVAIPASGRVVNQLGPIAAWAMEGLAPEVPEVMVLLRAGAYTHHPARAGEWTGLAALFVRYEVDP